MTLDLAALENGGRITACSNMFYSSPNNLLLPGIARTMGEGWETSRRRDSGNDWVQVHLAGRGVLNAVELDTSYFVGNAPGVGAAVAAATVTATGSRSCRRPTCSPTPGTAS